MNVQAHNDVNSVRGRGEVDNKTITVVLAKRKKNRMNKCIILCGAQWKLHSKLLLNIDFHNSLECESSQ